MSINNRVQYSNTCVLAYTLYPGDFHFLWECLKVLLLMFWGSPTQVGSLCNIREFVRRVQVDKGGKVFNVCDEFLLHAYKSHLIAAICTQLHIDTPDAPVPHESTLQLLEATANLIVSEVLFPSTSTDPLYGLHRSYCIQHFCMQIFVEQFASKRGMTSSNTGNGGSPGFLLHYAIEAAI